MSIEAMRQALEVLEQINQLSVGENAIALPGEIDGAMDNLRSAIEQAEEPWVKTYSGGKPNYTVPIERQWVGLTEDEIENLEGFYDYMSEEEFINAIRGVEAKLKEKNA
jgi:hypothetical protein